MCFIKPEPISWLIVGLGNPGQDYEFTRHNAGFLCLDVLCSRLGCKPDRYKFHALTCTSSILGQRCLLLKPQTYMNESGFAVAEAARYYDIPPERVLVLFDDISLPPGALRIRRKGSSGGHKGIISIMEHLGSQEFPRIKIGVGERPHPDFDLKDWVLSKFSKAEIDNLRNIAPKAAEAAELIVAGKIEQAMAEYNS